MKRQKSKRNLAVLVLITFVIIFIPISALSQQVDVVTPTAQTMQEQRSNEITETALTQDKAKEENTETIIYRDLADRSARHQKLNKTADNVRYFSSFKEENTEKTLNSISSNFQLLGANSETKNISGIVSLPSGQVAPSGGVPVEIIANNYKNEQYDVAKTTVSIPQGQNSVLYVLSVPADYAYSITAESIWSNNNKYYEGYGDYTKGSASSGISYVDVSSQDKSNININLSVEEVIKTSGTIYAPNGEVAPVGGIAINILIEEPSLGRYSSESILIPVGSNSVSYSVCTSSGEIVVINYTATWIENAIPYGDEGNIAFTGSNNLNGDITLNSNVWRFINGTVSLPSGVAIEDKEVNIVCQGQTGWDSKTTTILKGTSSANYSFVVKPNQNSSDLYSISYLSKIGTDSYVMQETGISNIDVSQSSANNINFSLESERKIQGLISLPVGEVVGDGGLSIIINAQNQDRQYGGKDCYFQENTSSLNYEFFVPISSSVYSLDYRISSYNEKYVFTNTLTANVANSDATGIDVILENATIISGIVSLPDGQVAPTGGISVSVSIEPTSGGRYESTYVTIPVGSNSASYKVLAPYSITSEMYILSYYIGTSGTSYVDGYYSTSGTTTDYNSATPIDISLGEQTFDMTLVKGTLISGTISLPSGKVAPSNGLDIEVTLIPVNNSGSTFNTYVYIEQGKNSCTYNIVLPQSSTPTVYKIKYYIQTSGISYIDEGYYSTIGTTTDYNSATPIDISQGDQLDLNMVLLKYTVISGTVSLPEGEVAPIGGIELEIYIEADYDNEYFAYSVVQILEGSNSADYFLGIKPSTATKLCALSYYLATSGTNYFGEYMYYNTLGMTSNAEGGTPIDISKGDQTVNMQLIKDTSQNIYSETFDDSNSYPIGWESSSDGWSVTSNPQYPSCYPVSSPNCLMFNSYDLSSGTTARFYSTQDINIPLSPTTISFYMYHDNENGYGYNSIEGIQFQYSTDSGASWTNIDGNILRYQPLNRWMLHNISLTGISGNIRIAILGTSGYESNIFIDNLSVYEDITYEVSYNANGCTGGTVPVDSKSYTDGEAVTIAENTGNLAKTGYAFTGWNTEADGSGTNYSAGSGTFSMVNNNITLYAQWLLAPINIGDYVQMGKYYDEPILWRCVDIDENGPLMLADRILTIKPFDVSGTHKYADGTLQADSDYYRISWGSNLWETSNLRSWLNSTATAGNVTWLDDCPPTHANVINGYNDYATEKGFMADGNFAAGEQNAIKTVTQKSILNGIDVPKLKIGGTANHISASHISTIVQNYDIAYYHNVTDKMFLLDVKQLNKVYQNSTTLGTNYYIGKPTQKAVDNSEYKNSSLSTGDNWYYWNRTPASGSDIPVGVRGVYSGGTVLTFAAYYNYLGVRPAFYLNTESVIFQSGNGTAEIPYIADAASGNVDFKGSSLGDPSRVAFPPAGGQHNLTATYQNNTGLEQSIAFIVVVKKNDKLVSVYTKEGIIPINAEYTFNQTIDIPSTIYGENVEVDFCLWDGLATMKPKSGVMKNYINPTTFGFKGSSLGADPANIVLSPTGGVHNLTATYQNNTNEVQNTVFIVAVKKNNKLISTNLTNKRFEPSETFNFTPSIDIPATTDNANVEVDFYLWDGLGTMKTKHDTVKNSINNVR